MVGYFKNNIIDIIIGYEKESYLIRKESIKDYVKCGNAYKNSILFAQIKLRISTLNFKSEVLSIFL